MPRQVAFVTGASRGIGRECALHLARAGFDVAITARTVHEGEGVDDSDERARLVPGSLDTTAAEIESGGTRALAIRMDLLDRASLGASVQRTLDEWGHIDVLVNNAVHTGAGGMSHFLDTSVAALETKLEANVLSQVVLIKAVLPGMLERGDGTIVNITSAVAFTDPPAPAGQGGWGVAYAMSKGAFHRMAPILALELGPRGLRVFNVEPGFVLTERMVVNQREHGFEGVYRGAPPSVPASVVAWLATAAEAGEFNGQTVSAQRFALERRLHPDWRPSRTG
ncbi:MAG: SDR family oxidoreductase [Actinobacteria bacterium]|nr:SDR family oxidoreductase [Actinomycetota bacterium]